MNTAELFGYTMAVMIVSFCAGLWLGASIMRKYISRRWSNPLDNDPFNN